MVCSNSAIALYYFIIIIILINIHILCQLIPTAGRLRLLTNLTHFKLQFFLLALGNFCYLGQQD